MNYTIDKDPKVKLKIERDLEYIKSNVLHLLGNCVHSILLCGGFGRGEGSVVVENGEVHIVNDYDFTVTLKTRSRIQYARLYKKYHAPLEELAENLSTELCIKQVDLSLKPIFYFTNATGLRIENYEVKSGNVLLHGSENPTAYMPDWQPKDIPLFEGTWLFRNRGVGMLIAALYLFCDGGIPDEKKENFIIECTKAQLAMGDAILLLKGVYHHLYSERLKRIANLDVSDIPFGKKVVQNYKEALNHKLQPNFDKYYQRDLSEMWFGIANLMGSFSKYFEQQRLKMQFGGWRDYVNLPKPEDRFELKTFISKMLKNGSSLFTPQSLLTNIKKSRKSYSISLIVLLLFSIGKDRFSNELLEMAGNLQGKPVTEASKRVWIRLAKAVLDEIHPGGEVANALKLHSTIE